MRRLLRAILRRICPPTETCVACTLPIERGSPTFPYARGGRVHATCAFGRFAPRMREGMPEVFVPDRSRMTYETRDSPRRFEVEEMP